MRANRKPVLMPIEGMDFSKPAKYIGEVDGFPKNLRIYRNELRKREGTSKYGSVAVAGAPIMGLGVLELPSGTKYLLRCSTLNIEYYDIGTSAWVDINVAPFAGTSSDFFSFANMPEQGYIAFTNGVDLPRKWTGSGNNSVLLNAPKCKYLCWVQPYLLAAHTTGAGGYPFEIKWCDTDAPTNWTTGNSGSQMLSDDPSPIKNVIKMNEYAAIYKRDSLWLGRKVSVSDVWQFDCVFSGDGLFASRTVADVNGIHYFMGKSDFYRWNGSQKEPIGEKVRDDVFRRVSRISAEQCHALHVAELSEVWWYIITAGNSYPTEIWKYNYRKGFWYYDTCNNITASTRWYRVDSETWNDESGTWDEAMDVWDEGAAVADYEEIITGRSDGHTLRMNYNSVNDDDVAVAAEFVSKDFTLDADEFYKRWLQLDVEMKGIGNVYAYYSIDEGNAWVNIPYNSTTAYVTLSEAYTKYEFYCDVVSEKIRFKFTCDGSSHLFYMRGFRPYYRAREEVRA